MNAFSDREITKVLNAMIGPTDAEGDSAVDAVRLDSLRTLIDVTNWCLDGLLYATKTRHRQEASMREIGETAFSALLEIKQWIQEVEEEEEQYGRP